VLADQDNAGKVLTHGSLELVTQLDAGQNAVFKAVVELDGLSVSCVYKPIRGERPLWDFPDGNLASREAATFLVSQSMGLTAVPVTVLRDGPLGLGACQQWIDNDPEQVSALIDIRPVDEFPASWRAVVRGVDQNGAEVVFGHADDVRLQRLALLDAVVNNADRKAGHLFVTEQGTVFGIDHGLTFNAAPKLRTVLWGWLDEAIPVAELDMLAQLEHDLANHLGHELERYLSKVEVQACLDRVVALRATKIFPRPSPQWPALPWPLW
jgi:uncharacterized repeat protein (TIGR03843 family)